MSLFKKNQWDKLYLMLMKIAADFFIIKTRIRNLDLLSSPGPYIHMKIRIFKSNFHMEVSEMKRIVIILKIFNICACESFFFSVVL